MLTCTSGTIQTGIALQRREVAASLSETRHRFAAAKVQNSLSFGQTQEPDQRTLENFVVDTTRLREAQQELAMYFYTSNTPPERVRNPHLKRSFALLGADVPEPRDLRGSYLDAAAEDTKKSVLEAVSGKRYAIVTDGWSKRTAVRGAPLINVNICPEDAPAIFWRVEDASGRIKDKNYVVQLHQQLRVEMQQAIPCAQLIGYVMDSTATNVAAMRILREEDPDILALPCASHALSNLIKHTAKYFSWLDSTYESCCTISEKLINSQKLRAALHEMQKEEYGSVRGICAHVPTRFGSKHLVLRDVLRSEAALRKLAASAAWRAALADSSALKHAHAHITAAENDLFHSACKAEQLLGPVMDYIHQLEADQPMLSFLKGVWDKLIAHAVDFAEDNPELSAGQIPADRRKRKPRPTPTTLAATWQQDRDNFWQPAMGAAALLDPVNWGKNVVGRYYVPVAKLSEASRAEVEGVLIAFENTGEDAEGELTELETSSFPERYTKVLDRLCKRTELRKGTRKVLTVQPHTERVDFFNNALGERVPVVARAVNVLLSMPVSACAAERNWSRWGATFVPNRNRLGLEAAQKLIFVQQNDPGTRGEREMDVLVE
jgi:hypothetical protein